MTSAEDVVVDANSLPSSRSHNGKKRKYEEKEISHELGMDQSLPQQPALPEFNLTSAKHPSPEPQSSEHDSPPKLPQWQTEEGRAKKRAKRIPTSHSKNYPAITFSKSSRLQSQIKITDLQNLVLYILADGTSPQFVSVQHRNEIRKVVVLMVPGLEMSMFDHKSTPDKRQRDYSSPDGYYPTQLQSEDLPDEVQQFADMFEHIWPVKTPSDDKYLRIHSPLHAMLTAAPPKTKEEKNWNKNRKGVTPVKEPSGWKNVRVPLPEFLLTSEELLENDYVLHPAMYSEEEGKEALADLRKRNGVSTDNGWVDTSVEHFNDGTPLANEIEAGSITAGRTVLAMDCEMCMTGENEFSLTRISIVGWDGSVILDDLVLPDKPITNYVTQYSGITEEMLKPVTTTLRDIQKKLLKILHPRTILIGHSLNSDLTALKVTHPYIIDTSVLYPHPRGPPLKSSLKWLAQKYLNREIQKGHGTSGPGAGHNSIEDARTCLDLVKQKCEKGKEWGTSDSQGENIFKRIARAGVRYKNQSSSATPVSLGGKSSAAVDWGEPKKGPGAAANFPIGCKNDEEVMEGVIRAVKGDPDGKEIPGGGVDFVWGRLRELEALKGWWNQNRQVAADAAAKEEAAVAGTLTDTQGGTPNAETTTYDPAEPVIGLSNAPPPPAGLDHTTPISTAATDLTRRITNIYSELPPCTAFIVYSGSGDPREMSRLQAMQAQFKREYKIKKWDQLSVKWTDVEEQALRQAHAVAKNGIGFIVVK